MMGAEKTPQFNYLFKEFHFNFMKTILITGGNAGIGKATALKFGRAGAKVVVSGRRETEGQSVVDQIKNGQVTDP